MGAFQSKAVLGQVERLLGSLLALVDGIGSHFDEHLDFHVKFVIIFLEHGALTFGSEIFRVKLDELLQEAGFFRCSLKKLLFDLFFL